MKHLLGFLACLLLVVGLFGCSMSKTSTTPASSSADSHSVVLQSDADSKTASSGAASSKATGSSSSSSASATPAPSETPNTGNLPTAPLLAGMGLICLGCAGLLMLKRI